MTTKILNLNEFVNVLRPYLLNKSNTYIVNELISWIVDEKAYNKKIDFSDSTVSRYLNNPSNFANLAKSIRPYLDVKKFQSKFELGENVTNKAGLNPDKIQKLSDDLKYKGINDVHPSSVPRVLAKQLEQIIITAASKNYSRLHKPKKSSKSSNIDSSSITTFSLFINELDINDTEPSVFTIKKGKWSRIKELFNSVPIVMARAIFEPDDRHKVINHPYGEFANELIPNYYYVDEGIYNIKTQDEHDVTKDIYVDKNGKTVKDENGNPLKVFRTIKELNPPIPKYAYLGKVTSFTTNELPLNQVRVSFRHVTLKKFKFESLYKNHTSLGIPDDIFYNNDLDFMFFDNLSADVSNKLNKIINTK